MIPFIILAIESTDDRDFMIDLYVSYNRLMYATIIKIVADEWETEDLIQSALEKLIDKIPLLKTMEEPQCVHYIVKTCSNLSYSYLRKKKRVIYMDHEALDGYDSETDSPELWLLTQDRQKNISAAWESLDEKAKELLTWKYMLKKSDAEIADELCIQPSSVRMTLTRARKKFKRKIEELED